jgi:hypothetical protein
LSEEVRIEAAAAEAATKWPIKIKAVVICTMQIPKTVEAELALEAHLRK